MTEQTKRGPGRPPLKERARVQDMHLNLPAGLLDEIDAVRGNRNRKQFILEAIREKLDRQ